MSWEKRGSGAGVLFLLVPFHSSAASDEKPPTIVSLGFCRSVSFGGLGPLLLLVLSVSLCSLLLGTGM